MELTTEFIRTHIADSDIIFQRGLHIYRHGAMVLKEARRETKRFAYAVDGNYGDYTIHLDLNRDKVIGVCDCPYPDDGCKHTVAALLAASAIMDRWKTGQTEKNRPIARRRIFLLKRFASWPWKTAKPGHAKRPSRLSRGIRSKANIWWRPQPAGNTP